MGRPAPLMSNPAGDDLPVGRRVRVMLVDDSLVVRSILERIVEGTPGLQVCASVASAHDALAFLASEPVDVVVLDIEMPGMNGIDALPHILERAANARVLILSSNCVEGGPAAIEALALGASDTLAKPGRGSFSGRFAEVLTERILSLGQRQAIPAATRIAYRPPAPPAPVVVDADQSLECIAVAASTGGIPAFANFITHLDPRVTAPILLTQHLPDAFMEFYAKQIATMTGRKVCVAAAGMAVEANRIYLAPGDAHLMVVANGARREIALDRRPVENGCCPSADPMLASVADVYGKGGVAVVLSGMGRDGANGAARLKSAGGTIFAQAPESCVIWGMPGAVAKAGLATATLNPDAIALMLGSFLAGRRAS
ncbi:MULTISPECIES: chemotaxis-specific protein-glutamate methyltransferase CheB [unclassified Sphingopyxis]|uniref:chemotaxis-specific protein-glutamate methyltransferase CheB n=2 Tax=unclassified Sphingopyxis TaxID=2614943 RepID=UPI0007319010|nr:MULTISPECIES: chemotaxis-specific protein-glutamate methyltransferase CheB [unclassified Sphingopyxis]KTE57262.1 chemotaxis response regulator protein-glutamate methylesterase [Sphingopyxis sp. H071]KTE73715.1 chemotaxis response regulator protein-glutamate methylesterase [Sphingopyxis sp. H081]KTE27761.1 chemotaxis response regulator protein-glutamate methylesterase [Sphingopyxis sp. H057]KTE55858.1 chemotaxis response regulator protein-glutamate methylesterase [Sphingopyxis sp. H073]KTE56